MEPQGDKIVKNSNPQELTNLEASNYLHDIPRATATKTTGY